MDAVPLAEAMCHCRWVLALQLMRVAMLAVAVAVVAAAARILPSLSHHSTADWIARRLEVVPSLPSGGVRQGARCDEVWCERLLVLVVASAAAAATTPVSA